MVKAQSAMEFVTTYGWMLLILIIVLAALASMGILTPPQPVMCDFPSNFVCRGMKLTTDSNLTLDLYQNTGHDINIVGLNCTKNPGSNPSLTAVNVRINNSDHATVANGMNIKCLDVYGNNAIGRIGGYYAGKIVVYYIENDTGTSHLTTGDINLKYE